MIDDAPVSSTSTILISAKPLSAWKSGSKSCNFGLRNPCSVAGIKAGPTLSYFPQFALIAVAPLSLVNLPNAQSSTGAETLSGSTAPSARTASFF